MGAGRRAGPGVRRRRLGALRHERRTGRQAHDLPTEHAREAARAAAAVADRGGPQYNVLPLDDRAAERLNADLAGRPTLDPGQRRSCCSAAWGGCPRTASSTSRTSPLSVTAEVDVPDGGAEGVIIAQGGGFGGWSLYAKDGRPTYCYNLLGLQRFYVDADEPLSGRHAPGADGVRLRRRRPRQGRRPSRSTLDGAQVGEGRVEATAPMIFSADDGCDVGTDTGAPVAEDYPAGENGFTGKVLGVEDRASTSGDDRPGPHRSIRRMRSASPWPGNRKARSWPTGTRSVGPLLWPSGPVWNTASRSWAGTAETLASQPRAGPAPTGVGSTKQRSAGFAGMTTMGGRPVVRHSIPASGAG